MTTQVSLIPDSCNRHNGLIWDHPAGALNSYSSWKAAPLEKLQADKDMEKQNGQQNRPGNNAGFVRSEDTVRKHLTHRDWSWGWERIKGEMWESGSSQVMGRQREIAPDASLHNSRGLNHPALVCHRLPVLLSSTIVHRDPNPQQVDKHNSWGLK